MWTRAGAQGYYPQRVVAATAGFAKSVAGSRPQTATALALIPLPVPLTGRLSQDVYDRATTENGVVLAAVRAKMKKARECRAQLRRRRGEFNQVAVETDRFNALIAALDIFSRSCFGHGAQDTTCQCICDGVRAKFGTFGANLLARVFMELGDEYTQCGKSASAHKHYNSVSQLKPDSLRAHHMAGRSALDPNSFLPLEQALEHLSRAYELAGEKMHIHSRKTNRTGEYVRRLTTELTDDLIRCIARSISWQLGRVGWDTEYAVAEIMQLVDSATQCNEEHRGEAHEAVELLVSLIEHYGTTEISRNKPNQPAIAVAAAELLNTLMYFSETLVRARDYLAAHPGTRYRMGMVQWRLGSFLARIIELKETHQSAAYLHSKLVYKDTYSPQNLFARAEADFTSAIRSNPNIPDAYLFRAIVRNGLDNPEAALSDLTRATELNPELAGFVRGIIEQERNKALGTQ